MTQLNHAEGFRALERRGNGCARSRAISTESSVLNQTHYSSGVSPKEDAGTNPVELIAAAHAASFSLALWQELGLADSAPVNILTTSTVTLERLAAG